MLQVKIRSGNLESTSKNMLGIFSKPPLSLIAKSFKTIKVMLIGVVCLLLWYFHKKVLVKPPKEVVEIQGVTYSSKVLCQLIEYFTPYPPERGGFLFGSITDSVANVCHFEPDKAAATTTSTYKPSPKIQKIVNQICETTGHEFLGIIHSHPPGIYNPSLCDLNSANSILDENKDSLSFLLLPIITTGVPQYGHQAQLGPHHIIGSFMVDRSRTLKNVILFKVNNHQDLKELLVLSFEDIGFASPKISHKQKVKENVKLDKYLIDIPSDTPDNLHIILLFLPGFPLIPPLIYVIMNTKEIPFPALKWNMGVKLRERLTEGLQSAIVVDKNKQNKNFKIMYGHENGEIYSENECDAKVAGWRPFISNSEIETIFSQKLFARVSSIVVPHITLKKIIVVGMGSVGSTIVEQLVRCGCTNITIVDIETVEFANIGRPGFTTLDLGKNKVDAMKCRLLSINPFAKITTYNQNILENASFYFAIIENHDLIVAATDDVRVQGRLNRIAYHYKKISIFVALFDKAKGGEIVLVMPSKNSPCYSCTTKRVPTTSRHQIEDYNTQRGSGVVALTCDILNVANLAAKFVLGILSYCEKKESSDDLLSVFGDVICNSSLYYIHCSHYCDYWLTCLEMAGYEQNDPIPPHSYALGYFWHNPEDFEHCTECREACDVCGTEQLPLHSYPWIPLSSSALISIVKNPLPIK